MLKIYTFRFIFIPVSILRLYIIIHARWPIASGCLSSQYDLPPYPRTLILFPAGRGTLFFDESVENRFQDWPVSIADEKAIWLFFSRITKKRFRIEF